MNSDKVLVALVQEQADLFNRDASEQERVNIYQQIQLYQKMKKVEGR